MFRRSRIPRYFTSGSVIAQRDRRICDQRELDAGLLDPFAGGRDLVKISVPRWRIAQNASTSAWVTDSHCRTAMLTILFDVRDEDPALLLVALLRELDLLLDGHDRDAPVYLRRGWPG